METIAIIGAGAAGCFCAIEAKRRNPERNITIFEAGAKALAKVAVTGGGRCNLTNSFEGINKLKDAYPRGERLVKSAFRIFSPADTIRWWEHAGVRLTVQPDHCVFPVSQDAMQIVRTLENQIRRLGIELKLSCKVMAVGAEAEGYSLEFRDGHREHFDKVVVTTGGGALKLLESLNLKQEPTVPSLFTLRLGDRGIRALMGTLVDNAVLRLAGTAFRSSGTLLLTDWGVSGPATLKLSSYAARHLAVNGYRGTLLISWLQGNEEEIRARFAHMAQDNPQKQISSTSPEELTVRTWKHILTRAGLRDDIRWAELGSKGMNRLAGTCTADAYEIEDRCSFKEEFVTAGGVAAAEVNPGTLESRSHKGLFFAGEVLDIDAITGGFNLQAAWSTGYLVAVSL